jgi:hypothetical protein
MMEATKEERGYVATGAEVKRPTLRPVLLHYAIARHGDHGLRLLHVPLGFDEEALVVFSSWEAAQRYFLRELFSGEWMRGNALPANSSPYSLVLTRA